MAGHPKHCGPEAAHARIGAPLSERMQQEVQLQ
jgi:hypothetical protein